MRKPKYDIGSLKVGQTKRIYIDNINSARVAICQKAKRDNRKYTVSYGIDELGEYVDVTRKMINKK